MRGRPTSACRQQCPVLHQRTTSAANRIQCHRSKPSRSRKKRAMRRDSTCLRGGHEGGAAILPPRCSLHRRRQTVERHAVTRHEALDDAEIGENLGHSLWSPVSKPSFRQIQQPRFAGTIPGIGGRYLLVSLEISRLSTSGFRAAKAQARRNPRAIA